MSSLRTLAPFLRTALRKPANPLVSLQRHRSSPVVNLARTYASYSRDKPHVNIGRQCHNPAARWRVGWEETNLTLGPEIQVQLATSITER